jgi:hypothetical protein
MQVMQQAQLGAQRSASGVVSAPRLAARRAHAIQMRAVQMPEVSCLAPRDARSSTWVCKPIS